MALLLFGAGCTQDSVLEDAVIPTSVSIPSSDPTVLVVVEDEPVNFGITDDTIRVGAIADLSGRLLALSRPAIQAQQVYFDRLNDRGGVDGRSIELVVEDSQGQVNLAVDAYNRLTRDAEDGVALISHVAGIDASQAIGIDPGSSPVLVVPTSWLSGWGDDSSPHHVGLGSSYCVDAANGVAFLSDQLTEQTAPRMAILTTPGPYGQDARRGALAAATELGIEIVLDDASLGTEQQPDPAQLITSMFTARVNLVWMSSGPADLATLLSAAEPVGLDALWAGSAPNYSDQLLGGGVAPSLNDRYFHVSPSPVWGVPESPAMANMAAALAASGEESVISTEFVRGWLEAIYVESVIRKAIAGDELSRDGLRSASRSLTVDFDGLVPNQTWSGGSARSRVTTSFVYAIDSAVWDRVSITAAAEGEGGLGFAAMDGNTPFQSDDLDYEQACGIPATG